MDRIGRHPGILYQASPNALRTGDNSRTFIVLHGSGGSEVGSESWINDPISRVSYHYFIGKHDQVLADLRQFVYDIDIAWHVGQSRWIEVEGAQRRTWVNLNDHSIGVCLESMNTPTEHYPERQLQLCRELVTYLMRVHGIPSTRVLTHRMVSDPVGRKVDPVNFPYEDFIRSLVAPETAEVHNNPRMRELEGLRLFIDNQPEGRIAAARIVGDKLYINREQEAP